MSRQLRISKDLSLPLGIANKTICIFGKGGSGKSNLEVVLAEELYAAGIPTCIVDPADVHYGIKSARDGKSAGLPFIIFGGLHADVPIYPENGKLLADLFLDRGLYMVIVTQPWTGGERSKFMTDFANQLYKRGPEKEQRGSARVLLLEEAHEYVPLSPGKDEAVMLGAMKRLYTVGRNYWIGFIAATRRPARMHTDLRNGADATAFFQIVGTQDRKAMTDYLGEMAEKDVRDEIVAHVAKLPVGTAYFYQPHEVPALQRVHFRYRDTLDTTTTEITAGHKAIQPVLAKVDLSKLGEAMEAAREKAKADDPKELRKTISELRAQIKKSESAKPQTVTETKTKTEIKTVEKRVVITGDITRLEKLQEDMNVPIERLETLLERAHQERSHIKVALTEARELNAANMIAAPAVVKAAPSLRARQTEGYAPPVPHRQLAAQLDRTETNGDGDLAKGPLKLLRSIVQFGRVTRDQLTLLSGYTQSSRDTYLKVLSSQGLVVYPERGEVEATADGRDAAGEVEALPTGQDLIDWWLARLPSGHAKVFQAVVSEGGSSISRQRITEMTGYTQSSRDTYIKKLKTRRLIRIPSPGMIAPAEFLFQ